MNRKVENWIFWILVNMIAVPLYFVKGLTLTAFLYLILWVNAIAGYIKWRELYESDSY
jgi:nicotinamide mononucleotide transporter